MKSLEVLPVAVSITDWWVDSVNISLVELVAPTLLAFDARFAKEVKHPTFGCQ